MPVRGVQAICEFLLMDDTTLRCIAARFSAALAFLRVYLVFKLLVREELNESNVLLINKYELS